MKNILLYVHDHKFIKSGGFYYSEGKFTNEVFNRYKIFSNPICVLSRLMIVNNKIDLNKIDGIDFKPVYGIDFLKIFSLNFLKNLHLCISLIKKSNVLVIRLPSFLGIFVLILNIFFQKRYFVELVGDPKEALLMSKNNTSFLFKIFVNIFAKLNQFFVKRSDGVIYVTKNDLQKKYPTDSIQSYASNVEVNIPALTHIIDNYNLKNKGFLKIGLIGSFNNEYKGIDTALNAVKYLIDNNIKVSLHILGSGVLKNKYIKLAKKLNISDFIHFDGSLSGGEAVLNWLKDLDIYIQPSRTEGLPRALIEAMSVGLPCIATNVGGIPELLQSDDLIEKDDYISLAKKIEYFFTSTQIRYKKGVINYEKSKEYDVNILKSRRAEFWNTAKAIVEQDLK